MGTPDFPIRLEERELPQAELVRWGLTVEAPGGDRLPITGVTAAGAGASSVQVDGDQTAGLVVGDTLRISGSSGNDGLYTVRAGSSFAGGTTTVNVSEAVPDATADGALQLFQPYADPYAAGTVHRHLVKLVDGVSFDNTAAGRELLQWTDGSDAAPTSRFPWAYSHDFVPRGALCLLRQVGGLWWIVGFHVDFKLAGTELGKPGNPVPVQVNRVYVVHASDGETDWTADTSGGGIGGEARSLAFDSTGRLAVGLHEADQTNLEVYDTSGSLAWTKTVGSGQQVTGVAFDPSDNLLVVTRAAAGSDNLYKYDSAGTLVWSRNHDTEGHGDADLEDVAADRLGNVWVCGQGLGAADNTARKYDPDGTLLVSLPFEGRLGPGPTVDTDRTLALHPRTAAVAIHGGRGTGVFSKTYPNLRVYDADGAKLFDLGTRSQPAGIAVDLAGHLAHAGDVMEHSAIDGPNLTVFSDGRQCLHRRDADGDLLWSWGSSINGQPAEDLALDHGFHVYLARGSGHADPGGALARIDPRGITCWGRQIGNAKTVSERSQAVAVSRSVYELGS